MSESKTTLKAIPCAAIAFCVFMFGVTSGIKLDRYVTEHDQLERAKICHE